MAWINLDSSPTAAQAVVARWDDTSNEQWILTINSQKVVFAYLDTGFSGHSATGGTVIGSGSWIHVAGIFTGSKIEVFVNGVVDGSTASTNPINHSTSTPVTIGNQNDNTAPFKGSIAEVSLVLVNTGITPLSQYELLVKACANGGTPTQTEPLVDTQHMDYWPLLGENPEHDYVPTPNNGTVSGTTIVNHPPVRTLSTFGQTI